MAKRAHTLLMAQLRDFHERYQATHQRGMKALKAGNLDEFAQAIKQEREIIKERRHVYNDFLKRR